MSLNTRISNAFLRSGFSLVILLLVGAASAHAQQATPSPLDVQPAPDSIQEMVAEYQEKAQRYTAIQSQVMMANEDLQERQAAISDLVVTSLFETHPEAEAQIARLDAIEAEAAAAQQAQDMDLLGQLIAEAGSIQNTLQTAQDRVLEQENVKTQIDGFEADLMALMLDVDPEAQTLRTRLDELSAILNAAGPPAG